MAGCLILNEETAKAGESYYRISPDTFQKATDRVTDKLYRVEGEYHEKVANEMDKQGFKSLSTTESGVLDIKIKAIIGNNNKTLNTIEPILFVIDTVS